MLSFDALAADVYWIRTIQHYGRDRKSIAHGRIASSCSQPLLDLTTTLDPHFNIAYRFGAIFLALDAARTARAAPDQAIALLEKGLAANPTRWQYAHDIGVHLTTGTRGDYAAAADWFERAAAMPGAPAWIRPLAATTRAQGGDRAGRAADAERAARVARSATSARAAERGLDAARRARRDRRAEAGASSEFYARTARVSGGAGRPDARVGHSPALPPDPTGTPFVVRPGDRTSRRCRQRRRCRRCRRRCRTQVTLPPALRRRRLRPDDRQLPERLHRADCRRASRSSRRRRAARRCRTPIAWYDNIPVLSYLVLGGKCRACRAPISVRYPLVEIVDGRGVRAAGRRVSATTRRCSRRGSCSPRC